MEDQLKKHGAISWSELLTTDVDGAKAFYGALFNWTFEDMPMEDTTYTVFKAGADEIGGMMLQPEDIAGMHPAWGLYITVEDVDATAAKAETLGAKICIPPQDIPETGRFCLIQDPQGAYVSIISYVE